MLVGIRAGTNIIPAPAVVFALLRTALCKPTFILVQKNGVSARTNLCCFRKLLQLSLPLEMRKKNNLRKAFAYQIIIKRLEIQILSFSRTKETILSHQIFFKKQFLTSSKMSLDSKL